MGKQDSIPPEARKLFEEHFLYDVEDLRVSSICEEYPELQPYFVDLFITPRQIIRLLSWIGQHPDKCYVDLDELKDRMFTGFSAVDFASTVNIFLQLRDAQKRKVDLADMLDRIFDCTIEWNLPTARSAKNIYFADLVNWLRQFDDFSILLPRLTSCDFTWDFGSIMRLVEYRYPHREEEFKEVVRSWLERGAACAIYVQFHPEEYYDFFNRLTTASEVYEFIHTLSLRGSSLREAVERIYMAEINKEKFNVLQELGFPFVEEFIECVF